MASDAFDNIPIPQNKLVFDTDKPSEEKKSIPTLTPSQATTLYVLMAASVVGGYWVPNQEEYDAIKTTLWAISENKEC